MERQDPGSAPGRSFLFSAPISSPVQCPRLTVHSSPGRLSGAQAMRALLSLEAQLWSQERSWGRGRKG